MHDTDHKSKILHIFHQKAPPDHSVLSESVFSLTLVVGCFIVRKLAPHFLNKLFCYHHQYKSKFSILAFNSLCHKYMCLFQCLEKSDFGLTTGDVYRTLLIL